MRGLSNDDVYDSNDKENISLPSLQDRKMEMRPKFTFFAKTSTQDNEFVFLELRHSLFEVTTTSFKESSYLVDVLCKANTFIDNMEL